MHLVQILLPRAETAIGDPVLVVTDLADSAMKAAGAQGIASGDINEEIGSVYEVIIHALQRRRGGRAD
ncbi:MAG: DUF768 domain-containing protein [Mesorhizobium sp.]|jgi:hypothetical protein|uniref:DUF768 domain-containing protein n=2 Tax=Mesorhizobium TaxID=68287 RepID=A0A2P9AQ73_9HYPH|nr:MAG: DUF768 domain-containing protein [Mesorhizobium sp.]UVC17613.1 DUF768 domain-containing protein [Mesorhizobium onobrychidis]SJM33256.1 hypothetical protein BQ8482_340152 [Mesorhizobium delmotii]